MDLRPDYREHFFIENGRRVDLTNLIAGRMTDGEYTAAHKNTVIATHDAVINYNGGVVLMERTRKPLKGFLWIPGGRMARGVPAEQSLTRVVKRECGLDITDLEFVGVERAFMPEDPLGHGRGTDTLSLIYLCRGEGNLLTDIDENHNKPLIVTPQEYVGLREIIHPFVQKYTDIAIERLV